MPPTETQNTLTKKTVYLIILGFIILQLIIAFFFLVLINNKKKEILSLKAEVTSAKVQANDSQTKLKNIAFAVHPETEYASFRKNAYLELLRQTFPGKTFDDNRVVLVRVFSTSAFRNAHQFFGKIQNDDIVLYDDQLQTNNDETPLIVVRPREQKVITHGLVPVDTITKARSGNKSQNSLIGPTLNFLSEQ